jgi:uncharacterized delta-60 repeat protein
MKEKLLRVALPILCLGLVQCTSNTGTTSGAPTAFATLRLNPTTGIADSGFGGTGIVVTRIDPTLFGFAMAAVVQPLDSRIVVGGSNGLAGQGQVALVRYNTDGSLDTGFGIGGIVKTPLPLPTLPAFATAIAIQPADNKIVVAALAFEATTNGAGNTSIVLLRYNPNGTLDTTNFGTNGIAAAAPIGSGNAGDTCALLVQGAKFVVAGGSQDGNIVLYRYDSTGALDPTFGALATPGKTTTSLGAATVAMSPAMAAQSDGRIILVSGNGSDQVVLRYSIDGALDMAFGGATGGIVTTDIGSSINYANAVAIQSTGAPANLDKIVVVGHTGLSDTTSDISLVRYSKDGVLDTTNFGPPSGFVTTDINGQFDNAFSVALQDLGGEPRILVSGNTGFNGASQTVVLRYNSDGTADKTFGSAQIGLVRVPLVGPSTIASGNAIAIQPLGIVVAGYD